MTRKIDYLFLRKGSRNWQLKLQSPRIEKSLGTPDRAQAEILALPYIQEHKVRLLEAKPGVQVTWRHRFAPGQEHVTPDGERIVADAAISSLAGKHPSRFAAFRFRPPCCHSFRVR
jgi:hypothetical protein